MIQEFACNCLNVTLTGSTESVSQQEVNLVQQLIDSTAESKRNELTAIFSNSRLIKLTSFEAVRIRHNFLCLKHSIANWQVNYCTVCEKQTHATVQIPAGDSPKAAALDCLVLACMNDADKVKLLKASPAYSAAFGIVLPRKGASKSVSAINLDDNEAPDFGQTSGWNFLSEVELLAAEEVQRFIAVERKDADERIKNFTLEQNRRFEQLRQTVLDEQSQFTQMVKGIKQQYDLLNDTFDKENNSAEKSEPFTSTKTAELSAEYIRRQDMQSDERTYGKKQSSSKVRSSDFDDELFDMDDIDVESGGRVTLEEATPFEEDEAEEQDIFPLKEANLYPNEVNQFARSIALDSRDENVPLSRPGMNIVSSDANSRRKVAYSVVQNIPHPYQSKSRYHHQTPNSLPIKIPHFRTRMSDLDNDEGYDFKSGESIADRIMKIARSERNENEIDDRPRRRLNTGDIVKSRRILN